MKASKQNPNNYANLGFWHIEVLDDLVVPTLGTSILALPILGAIKYASPETFDLLMDNSLPYLGVTGMLAMAGGVGEIITDVIIHKKNKVNKTLSLENKLATKGIFRMARHPLYAFKTLKIVGASLFSSNPLGFLLGLKGLYHSSRACEEEEKSLEMIYEKEYKIYKKHTPSYIPKSSGFIFNMIKKFTPKKLTDFIMEESSKNTILEYSNPYKHSYN